MRLIFIFMLCGLFAFSQKNRQQIAFQYYLNGEYQKAVLIYEDLEKEKFSVAYYNPHFMSLLQLEEYKKAEKLARKLVKKFPTSINYQLEIGICQQKSGDQISAEKTYEKIYLDFQGKRGETFNLANTFLRHSMYQEALDVYLLSEELNPSNYFHLQKANIYSNLGNSEMMIFEYLEELIRNPNQKSFIISKIQKFLDNDGIKTDKNFQLVKKKLLLRMKKYNNNELVELLVWLFMQNNQFDLALTQAIALDKRNNFDGSKVFELGETLLDYEYFDIAVKAFEFVINKGQNNYLFIPANINKLYAQTKIIKINNDFTLEDIDKSYKFLINQLGNSYKTVTLLSNYAHFKAFNLKDLTSAKIILEETMSIPQIDVYDLAECKIEYADIQLLLGNTWEALLYYSQVEKDFKEHPIGHKAKLKRAKVSYYQGDFNWVQAQLKILKASTSKLISNDAMDLSLLISDNYNLDTSEVAMRLFAKSDLLLYQQNYEQAIGNFDSILFAFPGHSLSDEIYLRKAQIYFDKDNFNKAIDMCQKILDEWSNDILADEALYKQAKIYDLNLKNKEKAMELYEKLFLEYNSSIYASYSRKRFRFLRGDNIKVE